MPRRRKDRVDANQPEIVKILRGMGYSVQVGMDDILIGHNGKTFWFEIKDPDKTLKKDKSYRAGALKDCQIELQTTWKGHYSVVYSVDEILKEIEGD